MSERRPWVGDLIHDEDTKRRGIVTDGQGDAVWVLRPEAGPGLWTSEHAELSRRHRGTPARRIRLPHTTPLSTGYGT
ncbi:MULTISPECIES: hypothetical protein [Streptomyces]|uniref:Uncharacterized protein n=1 Tax=Streptomyces flavovirens TaxID=52258 RepID=A0ABV8N340_9ACTN|nr:hypothetical protein [Streptomyces sp. MBT51]MBK3596535.1 hypothetical protein [Streptomyces sp. MBT51]